MLDLFMNMIEKLAAVTFEGKRESLLRKSSSDHCLGW